MQNKHTKQVLNIVPKIYLLKGNSTHLIYQTMAKILVCEMAMESKQQLHAEWMIAYENFGNIDSTAN